MTAKSEKERNQELLALAQPHLEKKREAREAELRAQEQALREEDEWALAELAMLRRRILFESRDYDLGNGDMIRLRTRLTEKELKEVVTLFDERVHINQKVAERGGPLTKEEDSRIASIIRKLTATVITNPLITPDWLQKHPDEIAFGDIYALHAMLDPYIRGLVNAEKQAQEAIAIFRANQNRETVCAVPEQTGTD